MKRNIILQTAVAAMFGVVAVSAHAGIANGIPVNMAAQAIASAATPVAGGSVTYSTQSPVAIGTVYVYVKLNGGAKFARVAGGAILAATLVPANIGAATVTVSLGIVSTDQTFVAFPVAISGAALPVNATFTFRPLSTAVGDGGINTVTPLQTVGNTLTETISIGSTTSSVAVQSDVDTASTGNAINSVNGVAFTSLSSGAANFAAGMGGVAVETKKVDVISVAGTALTAGATSNTGASTVLLNFGGYKFTTIPAVFTTDGLTAFSIAANYTVVYSAVLTGSYGAALAAGGSVFLSANNDCTVSTVAATAGTAATGAAAFAAITAPTTNVPLYACMQLSTANAVAIPSTTPSLVVTLPGAAGTATIVTPAASLYPLAPNGGLVDIRTYVPASAAGYTTFVRVINIGGVASPITAAIIDATTGAVGASGVIVPSLAAGGAVTLTSAQIETAIGGTAPAAATRPRLRVAGATTLQAQSFILTNANGNFSDTTGAQ